MALRVVGYIRVSTDEQHDSGAGLEAQRMQIRAAAASRNWDLIDIREDAASGKSLTSRPGLQLALRDVETGAGSVLVVAKLDRLSRSLLDFAGIVERSRRRGWALVALDLGVDTTTPSGEVMANVLMAFAQYERRLIGQRTREALAVKRAQGIHLGRPRALQGATVALIHRRRRQGMSLAAIAARLNSEGRPTAHGGRQWYVSTVRAVLRSGERQH